MSVGASEPGTRGIQLTEQEAWERIRGAHTAIVTTLKADGWPVALPSWFVVDGADIYLRTPAKSKKVLRISRDPRASFLIESGRAWVELTAVQLSCEATVLDRALDREQAVRVAELSDTKYAGFSLPTAGLPTATAAHYGSGMATIRLRPVGPPLTWDNSRIRLATHR
ncbi:MULTISPECIES: pyridoxamine 5'-phosphate oxidase family protein [unclassified Frankia]|uniref:pyridoxamine 5'-phosphate oxidase family protein n=1 Tax=unclassified Frankia TaxID=2632575 RepID=UPI002AD39B00|nr:MULTISPECIES: pyridoxamine 5'-phosphate oxidase family protein [unclassified Frankia]